MYAIIRTGGKQYRVQQGDELNVELLHAEKGSELVIDDVLFIGGEKVIVGQPRVEGAQVKVKVVNHDRARKIHIFKFRRRKNYRRRQGHRQHYTRIRITEITA